MGWNLNPGRRELQRDGSPESRQQMTLPQPRSQLRVRRPWDRPGALHEQTSQGDPTTSLAAGERWSRQSQGETGVPLFAPEVKRRAAGCEQREV